MPPGIFPAAISLRMVSPSCFRAAGERVPTADVGDPARSSIDQPTTRKIANAAAVRQRSAVISVCHRFIDEQLEGPLDALAFRRRLLQKHVERLLLAYHIAAAGAVTGVQQASVQTPLSAKSAMGLGRVKTAGSRAPFLARSSDVCLSPDSGGKD